MHCAVCKASLSNYRISFITSHYILTITVCWAWLMEFSILMTFGMANRVNLWLPITTLTFVIYNNYTIQSIFNTSKMLLGIFLMKWKLISWLDSKVNENSRSLIEVMANILYSVFQTQFFFYFVCIFHHQGLVLLINTV